jgi:hypothetical protein
MDNVHNCDSIKSYLRKTWFYVLSVSNRQFCMYGSKHEQTVLREWELGLLW